MMNHPTTVRAKEHVERLRARPLHVRENIALGISVGITLVVFAGWAMALSSAKTFALKPAGGPATKVENPIAKVQETREEVTSLLGAVGASGTSGKKGATSPSQSPQIKIIDSDTGASTWQTQQATDVKVIHF